MESNLTKCNQGNFEKNLGDYISEGGVGLLFCAKPVIVTGELDLDGERLGVGERDRTARRGDSELDRLRRRLVDEFLGDLDLERACLDSSLCSSSGDSLRNRRRTGLLIPFLPLLSGE